MEVKFRESSLGWTDSLVQILLINSSLHQWILGRVLTSLVSFDVFYWSRPDEKCRQIETNFGGFRLIPSWEIGTATTDSCRGSVSYWLSQANSLLVEATPTNTKSGERLRNCTRPGRGNFGRFRSDARVRSTCPCRLQCRNRRYPRRTCRESSERMGSGVSVRCRGKNRKNVLVETGG